MRGRRLPRKYSPMPPTMSTLQEASHERQVRLLAADRFDLGLSSLDAWQPARAGPTADERAASMAAMRERQNAMPDTPGNGRYPAMKEETPSLPDHVVYRPRISAS